MMGAAVRIGVVVAWLAVTGWYLVHQALPDLGWADESDPRAVLAARIGRMQHYDLLWRAQPTHAAERIGTCALGAVSDDVGVRLDTRLDITNTKFLPGERLLQQALGGRRSRGIRLNLSEMLDPNLRLHAISASGQIFGLSFQADGPVDSRGLDLTWSVSGRSGRQLIPEVQPQRVSGGELSACLPAGMRAGSHFVSRISTIDPTRLRIATKEAVFTGTGTARQVTAAGPAELQEVDMRVDGRRIALLYCDEQGVVHRQELLDAGLILVLTRITDEYGAELWPHPAAVEAGAR